jgi:hypothetical protein
MKLKRLWLRKLSGTSNAFRLAEMGPHRFLLNMDYPKQMQMPDGRIVPCFELSEMYEDKDGNWIRTWPQVDTYISLEQLMEEYVIEDSKVDSYIKGLEEFKELSLKEASKNMNKGFNELCNALYDPDKSMNAGIKEIVGEGKAEQSLSYENGVTDMDKEINDVIERKINDTDEGDKEDICALHSGESEANEEGPAE